MENSIYVAPIPIDDNPYQYLLYSHLQKYGIKVFVGFQFKLSHIIRYRKCINVIHFHWVPADENSLIYDYIKIVYFVFKLFICKLLCIKLCWTAHNLFPHDRRNRTLQYLKRLFLVHLVDLIIVHYDEAKDILGRLFMVSKSKMVVMAHGLYTEVYKNNIDKATAREYLNLSINDNVFLLFGKLRRYKNIESLIAAIKNNHDGAKLIIAGQPADESYRKEIENIIDGDRKILFYPYSIPNDDVQYYFNAADCVVLPYAEIFTSGVVMLAMGYGKPLIIKNCPFSNEYLNAENAILLNECNEITIGNSLARFICNKNSFLVDNQYLDRYSWDNIVSKFMLEEKVRRIFM